MNNALFGIYDAIRENWRSKAMYGIIALYTFFFLQTFSFVKYISVSWQGKAFFLKLKNYFLFSSWFGPGLLWKTLLAFLTAIFFASYQSIEKKLSFFLFPLERKKVIVSRILGDILFLLLLFFIWDLAAIFIDNFNFHLNKKLFLFFSLLTDLLSLSVVPFVFFISLRLSIFPSIFIGIIYIMITFFPVVTIFSGIWYFYPLVKKILFFIPDSFSVLQYYTVHLLRPYVPPAYKYSFFDLLWDIFKLIVFFFAFYYVSIKKWDERELTL